MNAKRLLIQALVALFLVYAAYGAVEGLRKAKPASLKATLALAMLTFAIGATWMYKHMTCPSCQKKFYSARRWLGMKVIPNE